MAKLFYLSALILLAGTIELAYGAIISSTPFMFFGVPAAVLGGLGIAIIQGEKKTEQTEH